MCSQLLKKFYIYCKKFQSFFKADHKIITNVINPTRRAVVFLTYTVTCVSAKTNIK